MKLSKLLVPIALSGITGVVVTLAGKMIYDQYWIKQLTIATAGQQGEYYAFGQALAQVIQHNHRRIRIQVRETSGSRENMQLLATNQVQLAIVQSDTPGESSVRAIASLFPEVFHLIAQRNRQIRTIADLRGKRVALMPKGSGSYTFFWQVLQHYGLQKTELQTIALPPAQASEQFQRGQVDALFRSIALGNKEMRSLIQATDATLVSIDQVPALKLSLATPYLDTIQVPKGTYQGDPAIPAQDQTNAAVQAMLLTNTTVSDNVIRSITASLYEHRNELASLTPRAATITPPRPREGLGLPLHPAAQEYYNQDQPGFLQEYAEAMGFLLSITILTCSTLWNLKNRFLKRQKNRADAYNLQVLNLVTQINTTDNLQQLERLRHELFQIFKTVVDDLDCDRITAEAFQAFAIPWQVAIASIRHQETVLQRHLLSDQNQPPGLLNPTNHDNVTAALKTVGSKSQDSI
jgi:uncharacterized protein